MDPIQNVVIIGAGNVGCHISRKLHAAGYTISQVAGWREANVLALANDLGAAHCLHFEKILTKQDLYIMALPDEAMEEILPRLPLSDELLVHTSGSVPMQILDPYSENTGVLYPLQTFTRKRHIDLKEVPVLIEANRIDNENRLKEVASGLSNDVRVIDSMARLYIHIAAVFASNFSNHMYDLARNVLEEQGLDFEIMGPLIMETATKAIRMGPDEAQTGPAKRKDLRTMQKHLELLSDNKAARELYRLISESIIDKTNKEDGEL